MITPKTEQGQIVQPRTLTNSTTTSPLVVGWVPVRQGSQDHENIPSRHNDTLRYRDGRVEALQ